MFDISKIMNNSDNLNWMDIKSFRSIGFLQEVNRQFFHPLGLCLVTDVDDEGNESIVGVLDYRNSEGGLYYGLKDADDTKITEFRYNALQVRKQLDYAKDSRVERLGDLVEAIPLEGKKC